MGGGCGDANSKQMRALGQKHEKMNKLDASRKKLQVKFEQVLSDVMKG